MYHPYATTPTQMVDKDKEDMKKEEKKEEKKETPQEKRKKERKMARAKERARQKAGRGDGNQKRNLPPGLQPEVLFPSSTTLPSSSATGISTSDPQRTSLLVPDAKTENGAAAFSTSGSALLDLFFTGLVRGASYKKLEEQMQAAWEESPQHTVQLLLQARDCRQGKGEKKVVEHCLWWLRTVKPRTYLLNLRSILSVGCYKDLLHMSSRALSTGPEIPLSSDIPKDCELLLLAADLKEDHETVLAYQEQKNQYQEVLESTRKAQRKAQKEELKKLKKEEKRMKQKPKKQQQQQQQQQQQKDLTTSSVDAEETKTSSPQITTPDPPLVPAISLAAKWAPSEGKSFDKLARRLADMMFPTELHPPQRMRKYRKTLSQLRAHVRVLETALCQRQWKNINFGTVPARAHHIYKKAFKAHAPKQYEAYLSRVKKGTAKVNVTGVEPHELVAQYLHSEDAVVNDTVEVQWNALLERLRQNGSGNMKGCLAMADVSGSMSGLPMTVSIALSLVVAQLTEGAFHNRVLTFSENPQWHVVDDSEESTLLSRVQAMQDMNWGMSTDLSAALTMIAQVGQANGVAQEDMPHTLFIFSDMQFNQAVRGDHVTLFQEAQATFAAAGYTLPRVVFWNLAGRIESFPVTQNEQGVAMVSGFSPNLLKTFLSGSDFTPLSILQALIAPYEEHVNIDPVEVNHTKNHNNK